MLERSYKLFWAVGRQRYGQCVKNKRFIELNLTSQAKCFQEMAALPAVLLFLRLNFPWLRLQYEASNFMAVIYVSPF